MIWLDTSASEVIEYFKKNYEDKTWNVSLAKEVQFTYERATGERKALSEESKLEETEMNSIIEEGWIEARIDT